MSLWSNPSANRCARVSISFEFIVVSPLCLIRPAPRPGVTGEPHTSRCPSDILTGAARWPGSSTGFFGGGHVDRDRDEPGQQRTASDCSILEQLRMKRRESQAVRLLRAATETAVRAALIHNF